MREWWDSWETFTGDSGTAAFSCGSSRNRASDAAGDWDVAIFSDADVVLGSQEQAHAAVDLANRTGSFVIAYSELRYLGSRDTEMVCEGMTLTQTHPIRSVGLTWINTFAIRRDLWDEIGGFDEAFVGYGPEDIAFYNAAGTMGGTERNHGPLYHLDHPARPEPPNSSNWGLQTKYGYASGDKALMRKVLDER